MMWEGLDVRVVRCVVVPEDALVESVPQVERVVTPSRVSDNSIYVKDEVQHVSALVTELGGDDRVHIEFVAHAGYQLDGGDARPGQQLERTL